MTIDEARIVVLEHELQRAVWLVEFMHGCLTNTKLYSYEYPDQTEANLEDWRKLLPNHPEPCVHSRYNWDCPNCQHHALEVAKLHKAKQRLQPHVDE